jgi:hypothetical protein
MNWSWGIGSVPRYGQKRSVSGWHAFATRDNKTDRLAVSADCAIDVDGSCAARTRTTAAPRILRAAVCKVTMTISLWTWRNTMHAFLHISLSGTCARPAIMEYGSRWSVGYAQNGT